MLSYPICVCALSFFGDLDGLGNVESSMSEQQLRYREGILEGTGDRIWGGRWPGFSGIWVSNLWSPRHGLGPPYLMQTSGKGVYEMIIPEHLQMSPIDRRVLIGVQYRFFLGQTYLIGEVYRIAGSLLLEISRCPKGRRFLLEYHVCTSTCPHISQIHALPIDQEGQTFKLIFLGLSLDFRFRPANAPPTPMSCQVVLPLISRKLEHESWEADAKWRSRWSSLISVLKFFWDQKLCSWMMLKICSCSLCFFW